MRKGGEGREKEEGRKAGKEEAKEGREGSKEAGREKRRKEKEETPSTGAEMSCHHIPSNERSVKSMVYKVHPSPQESICPRQTDTYQHMTCKY